MLDAGCYAQQAHGRSHAATLAPGFTAEQASRAEANAIDVSHGGREVMSRYLRLHVSGDTPTSEGAREIAASVRRWVARGGRSAWTYTHQWRSVARADWRGVSVLASVETDAQAREAFARGYGVAKLVTAHTSAKATKDEAGITWIPCPSQTRGVTCIDCKLCFTRVRFPHGALRSHLANALQKVWP